LGSGKCQHPSKPGSLVHPLYLFQGNVGSTEGGLHFCEEEEIIPAILEIAENSPIPSVRGCVHCHLFFLTRLLYSFQDLLFRSWSDFFNLSRGGDPRRLPLGSNIVTAWLSYRVMYSSRYREIHLRELSTQHQGLPFLIMN